MASAYYSEDLTCSICLTIFTDPVTLLCGHSFCRQCITDNLYTQHQCPQCRTAVPTEGTCLPTSHILKSLAEKAKEAENIKKEHGHEKAEVAELCPEHEEKLKLFCVTDQQLACIICRDGERHEGHKFNPVKEAAASLRRELETECGQTKTSPSFGSTREFGQTTTPPPFGSTRGFGQTTTPPSFGSTRGFGQTTTPPPFGSTREFGQTTTPPIFGFGFGQTATPPPFGQTNPHPSFGSTGGFGKSKTNTFGAESHINPDNCEDLSWLCSLKKTHAFSVNEFSSGQYYWEIDVGVRDYWELGIKENFLKYDGQKYSACNPTISTELSFADRPRKIGIYLNCESKKLSFYDADNMTHIHTVSSSVMPMPLSAYFNIRYREPDPNPMTVCWY
ncbi:nuclear factor 7, ovary isoform X5 [Lates calcarifer]|uniref:Nuclear factor 7, ovary isoform X5 n=1 Tax=Lates calcarifer TaxID=8187 RepID=A0AAJ8DQ43_LATCA|nr:nuclear factor 7, ovary isoform X5 [Lates calcarifer]